MQTKTKIIVRYAYDLKHLNQYLNQTYNNIKREVLKILPILKYMDYSQIKYNTQYYMSQHILFMYKQLYEDVIHDKNQIKHTKQQAQQDLIKNSINNIENITYQDEPNQQKYYTTNILHILNLGKQDL